MSAEPQRREQRKAHLDASMVPLENALHALADRLESPTGPVALTGDATIAAFAEVLASEYRELAEELHFW